LGATSLDSNLVGADSARKLDLLAWKRRAARAAAPGVDGKRPSFQL
jgi:hypothetical protein